MTYHMSPAIKLEIHNAWQAQNFVSLLAPRIVNDVSYVSGYQA